MSTKRVSKSHQLGFLYIEDCVMTGKLLFGESLTHEGEKTLFIFLTAFIFLLTFFCTIDFKLCKHFIMTIINKWSIYD